MWRYHLGLPKTATTHLQKVLESQRKALFAVGVDYIPIEDLRTKTTQILRTRAFGRWRFRRVIRSDARTALLSEETWLGHAYEACASPIYPRLEKRLMIISRPNAVAFLAIRDPGEFAASIYSEAMRHSPNKVSLGAVREQFLSAGSPWTELVERVRQFFPDLRVWRYEDYRGNEEKYISALAGTRVIVPEIPDPPETERLPAETLIALENLRTFGHKIPAPGSWNNPANASRFEMFTAEEKARLTAAYDRDVENLERAGLLI